MGQEESHEAQFEQGLGSVTAFAATTLLLLDLHDLAGSTFWEVFQLTLGIILQLDQVSDLVNKMAKKSASMMTKLIFIC